MWPNPQFSADLVTLTEKILNGKLHFLCSVLLYSNILYIDIKIRIFSIIYFCVTFFLLYSQQEERDFQTQYVYLLLKPHLHSHICCSFPCAFLFSIWIKTILIFRYSIMLVVLDKD